jgi:hypothetical protein
MISFLLSVDWGVALLTLAGIYLVVGIITALLWFKSDWFKELIVFFCGTSLMMAPVLSVLIGIANQPVMARMTPTTAIVVEQKEVYDIPKIYEYEIKFEEEEE